MNPEDSICYMQTADGRTINLSNLCGGRRTVATPALSGTDQQFLGEYQSFLNRRINTSPHVRTALAQAQRSPQSVVERARGVCSSIQAGISPDSTVEQTIDADLINTMALEYYCPEFDEWRMTQNRDYSTISPTRFSKWLTRRQNIVLVWVSTSLNPLDKQVLIEVKARFLILQQLPDG